MVPASAHLVRARLPAVDSWAATRHGVCSLRQAAALRTHAHLLARKQPRAAGARVRAHDLVRNPRLWHARTPPAEERFGSHFIIGFRMGGYITFSMEYQANQRASKKSISAKLSAKGIWGSASGSVSSDKLAKESSVNIIKKVRLGAAFPARRAHLRVVCGSPPQWVLAARRRRTRHALPRRRARKLFDKDARRPTGRLDTVCKCGGSWGLVDLCLGEYCFIPPIMRSTVGLPPII